MVSFLFSVRGDYISVKFCFLGDYHTWGMISAWKEGLYIRIFRMIIQFTQVYTG